MTDGRAEIAAAEESFWSAMGQYVKALSAGAAAERVAELEADAGAAEAHLDDSHAAYPVAWAEIESERTYEAREEAIRGTEAEQNADTALVEVEGVVSAEWDRYLTDSYFIGGPEPEAGS